MRLCCAVILADNKYHLWYVNNNRINYARSTDGLVWEEYPSNPVLTDGPDGDWDDDFVSQPSVIYDGTLYRMWFTGYDGSNLRIGYATSTDGMVWNKYGTNSVLNLGANGNWDDVWVTSPGVLFDGRLYHLFYTGYDGVSMKIGYATSPDGVVWNKDESNPVLELGANGNWDDTGVSAPSILYDGRLYRLFYSGYDGNNMRIGYAIAQVPLPNPLIANAGIDVSIHPGSSTTLNGSATGGTPPYSYSWNPGTGLDNSNIANPIASPSITTTYTLTVTDSNSWTAQDEVTITVSTATAIFIQSVTVSLTADDSAAFTCVAGDNHGNTWTVTVQTTFTADDPAGTMTGNLYFADTVGTWTITRAPNGGKDTITVFYDKTGAMATATIMVFMNSQQGGTITDKGVTIEFDPGDLGTTNVTVYIATSTQISQPLPGEIQCAGIVYNIALKDESGNEVGTQTGQIGTVTVYLAYSDTNDDGIVDGTQIKEEDLIIYQWENGNWKALTTWFDGVKNITWAYVPHFSTFTLGGIPTFAYQNNLIKVFVYPNPCRIYKGQTSITFANLTAQATIRIFNIAGEEVAIFEESDGDGKYIWQNPRLASGIYIYLITNDKNQKAIGKIGIIK